MTRYVAFLRAINIGGRRVKMQQLRHLFERFGLADVESFIASGNLIFMASPDEVAGLEDQLATHLEAHLGYAVAVFIRSMEEVAAIAQATPFPAAEGADESRLHVAFTAAPVEPESWERLKAHQSAVDVFEVQGREVYWLCPEGRRASNFSNGHLEKALGAPATVRGVRTVQRLVARYADASS